MIVARAVEGGEEVHIHVYTCPHLPSRQRLDLQFIELCAWMGYTRTSPPLTDEILCTVRAWIDDPTLSSFHTPFTPITHQIQLEWIHFLLGRIHADIALYQKDHYTTLGLQHNAQHWTAQLIVKLWTALLRPLWTILNTFVHDPNGYAPFCRLLHDTREEVRELLHSTDASSLHTQDQNLFTPSLDTILGRIYHQMRAWIQSVKIAIKSTSDSLRLNSDPSQPTLQQTLPATATKRPPLPTPSNTPNLTQVARRILYCLMKINRSSTLIPPLPIPTETPPQPPD